MCCKKKFFSALCAIVLAAMAARSDNPEGLDATHWLVEGGYEPGELLAVANVFVFPADEWGGLSSLRIKIGLPEGWQVVDATGDGAPYDIFDNSIIFWGDISKSPIEFAYTVQTTEALEGGQELSAEWAYNHLGIDNPEMINAAPDPLLVPQLGVADAEKSTVTAQPSEVVADGADASAVTVTVRDGAGNVLTDGGDSVHLETSFGVLTDVADEGDGTYTASLTSPNTGSATVIAYLGVDNTGAEIGTAAVSFVPGPAARLLWVVQPAANLTYGDTWADFSLEIADESGHRVSEDREVAIAPSVGAFVAGDTAVQAVDGLVTFSGLKNDRAGVLTLTATAADLAPSPASDEVTVAKADATIEASGVSVTYDGNPHGATGTATGADGSDLSHLLDLGEKFTAPPGGTAYWTFAGDANHNPANGSVEIEILKKPMTLIRIK